MSKNLTRKGLAFGALVALGSTALAGPAYAVDAISLAPVAGTSYNTTLGGEFQLGVQVSSAPLAADLATLRFKIEQSAKVFTASTDADLTAVAYAADTAANSALAANLAASTTAVTHAGVGKTAGLKLTASGTTSASAVVTAWFDLDNDGVIDATEFSSTPRTVNFLANADLSATASLTAPVIGATALAGSAVITPELNGNYATDVKISYTAPTAATLSAADVAASLASGKWSGNGAVAGVTAGAYTAQAKTAGGLLGSVASQTVAAATVSSISAAVTDNGDTQTITPANTAGTKKQDKVRSGVKSAEVVLSLKKADGTAVAAGIPAVVTVTSTAITTPATALVTVNGTAAAAVGSSITVNGVTDANGQIKLAVANQLGTAGDLLTFSATAEGVTLDSNSGASATGNQAFELTWADPAYTVVSSAVGSVVRSIAEGGSTTINYTVKDNFGTAIGTGARLEFVVGYTTAATTYVNVVGGVASITVTDTTANVVSAIPVNATLQTQSVATGNWAAAQSPITATTHTVNVTSTVAAFDTVPVASSVALSTAATLTASVNNPGAAVTVAANGVTFTVDGVEYANSVTLFSAASNGDISVSAKSNIAGAKTVTYTVGSESKTAVLTVGAAAETAGTNIDLSAVPATVVPGSTLVFTGYLKDVYGNAVDTDQGVAGTTPSFSVTYSGPGFIVGGSTPTATDADGKFTFTVILGVNDSGSATVSVKYDADAAGTVSAEISKSATVSVAKAVTAATAAASGSTAKIYASVANAAGKWVVVKVNGKFAKSFAGTSAKKVVAVAATAGAKNVSIYVGGTRVLAKVVTVK
ncbi:beta strand repeat-containing protein [Rhodoluna limnophila]|uniref:beta strand repeat-containing protein n=1 Tax=Rhodoluna limnophila TaxID=232537 RepID=UPI0011068C37|nr:hypothetical protein [Rhodoluna limnophila]